MKDLNKKLAVVREEHVEGVIAESQAAIAQRRFAKSLVLTGALRAGANISQTINKQTIKLLQEFRDNKDFEPLGFARFDEYLDKFEYSPMSYRQFNEQEKLLLKEGDDLFNVFTLAGISQRKRLILGRGDVEIDGETVIVKQKTVTIKQDKDGKDFEDVQEQEERIAIDDHEALLQAITALTERTNKQSRKLASQQQTIDRGQEDFESLKRKKTVKAKRDEIDDACGIAMAALGDLDRLLAGADTGRVNFFVKHLFPLLASRCTLVNSTLTEKLPGVNLAKAAAIDEVDATAALLELDD